MTRLVVRILLGAFALSFPLAAGEAVAQATPRQRPALTGDLVKDIKTDLDNKTSGNDPVEKNFQALVKKIQDLGRADLNYAILKATAANTNGSKVRLQCLQAILAAKDAAEGTTIKDAQGNIVPRPDPAVITSIEDVAELVDALSPQGPLMTGCAGAAQLFKTNTLQAINGIVTGAVGLAAGGVPIAIP